MSLSSETVAFIRNGINERAPRQLVKIDPENFREEVVMTITATTVSDPLDGSQRTRTIYEPRFVEKDSYLYFITDDKAYGSRNLARVDLRSGKWEELCSSDSFRVLQNGHFKGCLFVSERTVYRCAFIYRHKIIQADGKVRRTFRNELEAMDYLKKHKEIL